MASSATGGHFFFLVALSLLSATAYGYGQLSEQFYSTDCQSALNTIIETELKSTLSNDTRMGASLLRLFFHDCFVQGCDASVLLVDDGTGTSEQTANPNRNSLRGFEVINRIKDKVEVEKACGPRVVSCADILALTTKQAVITLAGQPGWTGWPLRLGRQDSKTANKTEANTVLPGPDSDLATLIEAFNNKNFTDRELVVLSGAHTIGKAKCRFADGTQQQRYGCSSTNNGDLLLSLDDQTPDEFDNVYYRNLMQFQGLLHSDRVLVDESTFDLKCLVGQYALNQTLFFQDFAKAMTKMSEMLNGADGEIRSNCSRVN